MKRKHSRFFSPSALARRIACTASAKMEDGKPDEAGEYALWGTAAHHICEKCATGGKSPDAWLGKTVRGTGVQVDQEMVDACKTALALMRELTEGADIETEKRVAYPAIPGMFGTVDGVWDEPFDRLLILDYKFGAVKVEAKRNAQLSAYALMVAGDALDTYREITLAIIQPRISDRPDTWTTTPADLARWRDETLMPAVAAIRSGNVTFSPSPETCRWCKGADDCPAYAQAALALARADFAPTVEPQPGEPAITPELVAQVYPQIGLLEDFLEKIKAKALELASQGNLPGFKLVEGRGRREWDDEEAAIRLISKMGADPFETKILSPAKAEKLGEDIKKAIQPLIRRLPGNPVVAPETDKRRAITTAQQDFAGLAPAA